MGQGISVVIVALLWALAGPGAGVARAQSSTLRPEPRPTYIDQITVRFAVGAELYQLDLSEADSPYEPKGTMAAITLDSRISLGRWQLRLDGRYAVGKLKNGAADEGKDTSSELRLLVGPGLGFKPRSYLYPYFGVGRRQVYERTAATLTTTGVVDISNRTVTYYYAPIGVETQFAIGDNWAIKPTLEYDHILGGESTRDQWGTYTPDYSDAHYSAHRGFGARASVMLNRAFGSHEFEIGPFLRYWDIPSSEPAPAYSGGAQINRGYEPASTTLEAGVATRFQF